MNSYSVASQGPAGGKLGIRRWNGGPLTGNLLERENSERDEEECQTDN